MPDISLTAIHILDWCIVTDGYNQDMHSICYNVDSQ
jgi:hypothetical protein